MDLDLKSGNQTGCPSKTRMGEEQMARSRNIKPGFFTNEILAECHPLARILFAGLWTIADREGRLEDRPKKIKAELLPYDDYNIDDLLNELASKMDQDGSPSFIIRYKINGRSYIQIVNFSQHQNPHIKEAASTLPAPDLYGASMVQEPDKNRTSHADSLLPITDSLLPITLTEHKTRKPFSSKIQEQNFDRFWSEYPRKMKKGDAEKVWVEVKPDQELVDTIMSALDVAKKSHDWTKDGGQYIPYPATWLRAKGWEDEHKDIHIPLTVKSDVPKPLEFYVAPEILAELKAQANNNTQADCRQIISEN